MKLELSDLETNEESCKCLSLGYTANNTGRKLMKNRSPQQSSVYFRLRVCMYLSNTKVIKVECGKCAKA